jgi:hypothetical protein
MCFSKFLYRNMIPNARIKAPVKMPHKRIKNNLAQVSR